MAPGTPYGHARHFELFRGPNEWKFGVSANFHPFRTYNAG